MFNNDIFLLKLRPSLSLSFFDCSPVSPAHMDWRVLFPAFFPENGKGQDASRGSHQVEFADIGCGYGGLLGTINAKQSVSSVQDDLATMLTDSRCEQGVCIEL